MKKLVAEVLRETLVLRQGGSQIEGERSSTGFWIILLLSERDSDVAEWPQAEIGQEPSQFLLYRFSDSVSRQRGWGLIQRDSNRTHGIKPSIVDNHIQQRD